MTNSMYVRKLVGCLLLLEGVWCPMKYLPRTVYELPTLMLSSLLLKLDYCVFVYIYYIRLLALRGWRTLRVRQRLPSVDWR